MSRDILYLVNLFVLYAVNMGSIYVMRWAFSSAYLPVLCFALYFICVACGYLTWYICRQMMTYVVWSANPSLCRCLMLFLLTIDMEICE